MAKLNIQFNNGSSDGKHNGAIKLFAQVALNGEFTDEQAALINKVIKLATGKRGLNARKFVAYVENVPAAIKYPASLVPSWAKTALKTEGFLTAEEKVVVEQYLVKGQGDDEETAVAAG